jgi:hypothetical protein
MNNTWTRISTSDDFKNTVVYKAIFFLFLAIITQSVAAKVSDCKTTDPRDVESVFHCVASYRQAPSGKNLFESRIESFSCRDLSKRYLKALNISGIRFNAGDKAALQAALPSCEIFSEITRRFTGNPSWWASCLGRPGSREHLKNCLTSSAKGYYEKGKPLSSFGGCTGLEKLYYSGLDAASNFVLWGGNVTIEPDYQAAFENLDCADYQAVLKEQEPIMAARWATCMNYSQENKATHLRACIGDEIKKLNSCRKVRSRYEYKMKEAGGGAFPPGYTMLDCSLAEPLIAEEKERAQKERLAAIERRKARADEKRRVALAQYRDEQRAQKSKTAPPGPGKKGSEVDVEFSERGEPSGSIIPGLIVLITVLAILTFLWRKGLFGKILNPFSSTDQWMQISTSEDFAHTVVYERDGPKGKKIYRVVFDNWEITKSFIGSLVLVALLFGTFPAFIFLGAEVGGFMALVLVGVGAVWLFKKFKALQSVKRAIEIDAGADKLRVLKNGRVELERQLSRMANLTVEEHPDAEFVRINRLERGEKKLKDEEKSHCLFGWFGIGGAEQVILITRVEWPNRNSLFEVRQAVIWARELAYGAGAPDLSKPEGDGIKPPLD